MNDSEVDRLNLSKLPHDALRQHRLCKKLYGALHVNGWCKVSTYFHVQFVSFSPDLAYQKHEVSL